MSWTEQFFGKYYLPTHLPVLTEEKTKAEVDFIEEALELKKGSTILDIPCGHGRHSLLLAERGYKVTGLDNQEDFLNIAWENVRNIPNINFIKMDMREIAFKNEFDAIISFFTSFGYFSEQENFDFLKSMAKALKKKGKIIIDTVNREWTLGHTNASATDQAWIIYPPENVTFLANNMFNIFTGRLISEQVIIDKGERYEQIQDIRLYLYTEMKTLLKLVGLEIIATYGNIDMTEYSINTPNMIIIAEKTN